MRSVVTGSGGWDKARHQSKRGSQVGREPRMIEQYMMLFVKI